MYLFWLDSVIVNRIVIHLNISFFTHLSLTAKGDYPDLQNWLSLRKFRLGLKMDIQNKDFE